MQGEDPFSEGISDKPDLKKIKVVTRRGKEAGLLKSASSMLYDAYEDDAG